MISREIIKKATELANEKHPDGFNKEQLIQCSKELFDGRRGDCLDSACKDLDDVNNQRNAMASVGYPVGMSKCDTVGISGGCGFECPVLTLSPCECENAHWMLEEFLYDRTGDNLSNESKEDAVDYMINEYPVIEETLNLFLERADFLACVDDDNPQQ